MKRAFSIAATLAMTTILSACTSIPPEATAADTAHWQALIQGSSTDSQAKEILAPEDAGEAKEIQAPIDAGQAKETAAAAEKQAAAQTAKEPEAELEPLPSVSIVMVGDILLHTRVEASARDDNGGYNFDAIFANTRSLISAADLALVNQEVILGGEELGISGYPAFNAPYEIGDALTNAGFDVVCHATNHALDKGKKGLNNTMEYWSSNHPEIKVVGINSSQEQKDTVDIIEKNGIKIAILNYTYGTNGISQPSDMPFAVDMLDETKVRTDLAFAEENADFTIVCPHWGTEYRLESDSSQKKWTEIFREGGADLVIGTHPHVIEPIEFLEDDTPGHSNNHGGGDMLVYYSLGNYVNWTSGSGSEVTNRMIGGMAKVTLTKTESGEVSIADSGVTALVCHVTPGYQGVTVYPLSSYTEEMAQKSAILSQDSAFSKARCVDLCNQVWGSTWE